MNEANVAGVQITNTRQSQLSCRTWWAHKHRQNQPVLCESVASAPQLPDAAARTCNLTPGQVEQPAARLAPTRRPAGFSFSVRLFKALTLSWEDFRFL